jgi:ATP-dependent DNA helicase RecQ
MNLNQSLEKFGLASFRPGQEQVIRSVMDGADVLCVMPTGGGKSLCYQLPSVVRAGLTIVVSPLIALMQDQVAGLHKRGIRATLINSTLTQNEQIDRMEGMAKSQYDLVYVAPERLRNSRFVEAVQQTKVTLLAIDEAHCVSEWGHDFRPDYARLGRFRERHLGGVQTIALTATATPTVRQDIVSLLGLKNHKEYITGFARPNLRLSVDTCSSDNDKDQRLLDFLQGRNGVGIIYAATRKRCEELAERLSQQTRQRFGVYHAGLPLDQRKTVQDRFMAGELAAIVATNAFGMGVDKADLRYVVHYNMPGSLEAYYQEAGRAGRDGLPSECRLLFSYSDRYIQEFFIENAYPTPETVQAVYEFLLAQDVDPIEMTLDEIREKIGIRDVTSEAIGTAESLLARTGVLERLEAGGGSAILRIDSDLETLVDLLPREAKVRRKVLQAAEKIVGKQRHEDVPFSLQRLLTLTEMERDAVHRSLRDLCKLKAFDYVPPFRGRAVHFRERDIPFDQLKIDFEEMARRKTAEYAKLDAVIKMAQSAGCRQLSILKYFGDPGAADCENCDRCDKHKPVNEARLPPGVKIDDLAKGVRIALSGVARMHGRFGKTAVAQMLRGSQNQKLQSWKLNRLSTFGLLAALQQKQVVDLLEALIAIGFCQQQDVDQRRPILQLTEAGRTFMNSSAPLPPELRLGNVLARRLAACASQIEDSRGSRESALKSLPVPQPPLSEELEDTIEPSPTDCAPAAATSEKSSSQGKVVPSDIPVELEPRATGSDKPSPPAKDESSWTVRLLTDGYKPDECCAIRRISKNVFFDHLIAAAHRGDEIRLEWFLSADDTRLLMKVMAAGEAAAPRLKSLLPNHISPRLYELARIIVDRRGSSLS